MLVDLFTNQNGNPAGYVQTISLPPFMPGLEPEVVVWGSRTFKKHSVMSAINPSNRCYIECFSYWVAA
jgi:hypothetical protein